METLALADIQDEKLGARETIKREAGASEMEVHLKELGRESYEWCGKMLQETFLW